MTTHMKLALYEINDSRNGGITDDTLPEVYDTDDPNGAEVSMGNPADGEYSVCVRERAENTADWHYRAALCHLSMWQYKLGEPARIKAAEEAAEKELRRRISDVECVINEVIEDDRAIRPDLIATAIIHHLDEQAATK